MVHQLWLLWLGCGVIGGVGQGLGYISPVSTLIKWFPDRRGMATGMAIMGYGGGAMIGAPIAVALMKHFNVGGATDGVALTLMAMGALYFLIMSAGAFGFRVAPTGWKPEGWTPPVKGETHELISHNDVHLDVAWKTPQFWLVWAVLCLNVTAGIGVISMASPMLQDVFGAKLIGADSVAALTPAQKAGIVAAAAGLVGLISLFNSLGRFFWASISDQIGRKTTYTMLLRAGHGPVLPAADLWTQWRCGPVRASVCLILTMYGGGFATVPAYLADLFGAQMVGAIHGRLLTAWSVAGVVGPSLIASLRESQLNSGVAHNLVYDGTLHILAGMLFLGLICNLLIRPVADKHHMTEEELSRERALQHEDFIKGDPQHAARGPFGVAGIPGLGRRWRALPDRRATLPCKRLRRCSERQCGGQSGIFPGWPTILAAQTSLSIRLRYPSDFVIQEIVFLQGRIFLALAAFLSVIAFLGRSGFGFVRRGALPFKRPGRRGEHAADPARRRTGEQDRLEGRPAFGTEDRVFGEIEEFGATAQALALDAHVCI